MVREIDDNKLDPTQRVPYVPPSTLEGSHLPHVDSGLSSIEKSKAVKPESVPSMDVPLLVAPNQDCMAFAVVSVDAMGFPVTQTLHSFILKGEEIKNSVLDSWLKNLREIEEDVRQILASPKYQQLHEILIAENSGVSGVKGIEEVSVNSSSTNPEERVEFLSTLNQLHVLERVPSVAKVSDTNAANDTSQVLVLPLTAAFLASVGLAINVGGLNPIEGMTGMIEEIQGLFPSVSVQDLIPLVNLMVVGPIYYNSWNEAISRMKSRDRHNHLPLIHNFAKNVMKIVSDPDFVRKTLVERMKGTENLTSEEQERLAQFLKLFLIGVALSLLYSVEVGKVQNGTFGGIEPEEFRDLLLGKFENMPDSNQLPEEKELTSQLIKLASIQLKSLEREDRAIAIEMLLTYLSNQKDVEQMLNPAKVFEEAINASSFNHKDKRGPLKA